MPNMRLTSNATSNTHYHARNGATNHIYLQNYKIILLFIGHNTCSTPYLHIYKWPKLNLLNGLIKSPHIQIAKKISQIKFTITNNKIFFLH